MNLKIIRSKKPIKKSDNMRFDEHEIVEASRNITEEIPEGTSGVIVAVHASAYAVEFIDENGDTIDVVTVYENDLKGRNDGLQ